MKATAVMAVAAGKARAEEHAPQRQEARATGAHLHQMR